MDGPELARLRRGAGRSQEWLAREVGTSRETVSAYERGEKSPMTSTLSRLLDALGLVLVAEAPVAFVQHESRRGRLVDVPTRLPRLDVTRAFATVTLPLHLDWSGGARTYHLANRRERARVYEIVLREGGPKDLLAYIDGALLVDLWDELVIPRDVREAWSSLMPSGSTAAA